MVSPTHPHARAPWRDQLSAVIFGTDTRAGRAFDVALIVLILLSVAVVVTDSIPSVSVRWHRQFTLLEWFFTALFTVEYIARLACAREPLRYATSFFGVVDLLALLPTYLALLLPETHALIDVRVLRLRAFSGCSSSCPMWPNTACWAAP